MKLLFKQRMFSWFDSYSIYDEAGNVAYTVQGKLSWGHKLEIYDPMGNNVGTVKEEIFAFLPRFQLTVDGRYIGDIRKEFTFFKPEYTLECGGWSIQGDFMGWNYHVVDAQGCYIMQASKEIFNWTDTYTIDVLHPANALLSLMIVLSIDAANCSEN